MKDWMAHVIAISIIIVVIVLCALLCRWWFNAVMASDYPDWVKYMLLRG